MREHCHMRALGMSMIMKSSAAYPKSIFSWLELFLTSLACFGKIYKLVKS